MSGRASVTIWCSHSGSAAQYASTQAEVAAVTAAARPGSGAVCSIIRSRLSADSRNVEVVSRSSSAVRRASSATASGPGRGPVRSRLAARISSRMRRSAAPARGSTEPVSGCGL